jgi:hypothetical protein
MLFVFKNSQLNYLRHSERVKGTRTLEKHIALPLCVAQTFVKNHEKIHITAVLPVAVFGAHQISASLLCAQTLPHSFVDRNATIHRIT